MSRWITAFTLSICLSLGMGACVLIPEVEAAPYVIADLNSIAGEETGYYNYAGIEFDFYNKSNKTIQRFDVSCMVFDATTKKNPFIGSNIVKVSFSGSLGGKTESHFIISLDPYMYTAPTAPYIIDFFYVAKIHYADGSTWEDSLGTYYTGTAE